MKASTKLLTFAVLFLLGACITDALALNCSCCDRAVFVMADGTAVAGDKVQKEAARISTPTPEADVTPPWNVPPAAKLMSEPGNLSDGDLIGGKVPYVAETYHQFLLRPNIINPYRNAALEGLAKLNKTDAVAELFEAIDRAQASKQGGADKAARDLASMLASLDSKSLKANRQKIAALAKSARNTGVKQSAYSALIAATGSADDVWQLVSKSDEQTAAFLSAVPKIKDKQVRASLYDKVAPLITGAKNKKVRRAAIAAAPFLPGHEEDVFNQLADLIIADTERSVALASIGRINPKNWPSDNLKFVKLADEMLSYASAVPLKDRKSDDFLAAMDFGRKLAGKLGGARGESIRTQLDELGIATFLLRAPLEKMKFDREHIIIVAGRPMEIALQNDDAMPHNLMLIQPKQYVAFGKACDGFQLNPKAPAQDYIPDDAAKLVLHRISAVESGQRRSISFNAPKEAGFYPYVCTMPGHWTLMAGQLVVAENAEQAEKYRKGELEIPPLDRPDPWQIEEIKPHLAGVETGRNFDNGLAVFNNASCATCHKIGKEPTYGQGLAPNLTEIAKKYKPDEILREMVEPGAVISEGYEQKKISYEGEYGTEDITVVIFSFDDDILKVSNQMNLEKFIEIPQNKIRGQRDVQGSLMPIGSLNRATAPTKEDVLDLIAFLRSGGDRNHEAFKKN